MQLLKKLIQEQQLIKQQRAEKLKEVSVLTKEKCEGCELRKGLSSNSIITKCRTCPVYEEFRQIGDDLDKSLTLLRNNRAEMKNVIAAAKLEKESVKKLAKYDVQEYLDLKAQGKTDTEIMKIWGLTSNSQIYYFKRDNGLLSTKRGRPSKDEVPETAPKQKTSTPVEEPKKQEVISAKEAVVETVPTVAETKLEKELAEVKAFIQKLQDENAALKNELWVDRWERLITKQKQLNQYIIENHNLNISSLKDEDLLALIVEIAEAANEEKNFKYWKQDKEVDREKLIEEVADILHIIMNNSIHQNIKVTTFETIVLENSTKQFIEMVVTAASMRESDSYVAQKQISRLVALFLGLVELLGFSWQEIERAYESKHATNYERQNSGY